jgi:hypothetical protein
MGYLKASLECFRRLRLHTPSPSQHPRLSPRSNLWGSPNTWQSWCAAIFSVSRRIRSLPPPRSRQGEDRQAACSPNLGGSHITHCCFVDLPANGRALAIVDLLVGGNSPTSLIPTLLPPIYSVVEVRRGRCCHHPLACSMPPAIGETSMSLH